MAGTARKSTHRKKASSSSLAKRRTSKAPAQKKRVEIDENVSYQIFSRKLTRFFRWPIPGTKVKFRNITKSLKLAQSTWNGAKRKSKMRKERSSKSTTSRKKTSIAFG